MKKIEEKIADLIASNRSNVVVQPRGVSQSLKAICSLLGNIEPLNITKNLSVFTEACRSISTFVTSKVNSRANVASKHTARGEC